MDNREENNIFKKQKIEEKSPPQRNHNENNLLFCAPKIFTCEYERLFGKSNVVKEMKEKDWSKTPLGPLSFWSQVLKTTLSLCLECKFPMVLWWYLPEIRDFVQLNNDAWVGLVPKHRAKGFGGLFSEFWGDTIFLPMLLSVVNTREAMLIEDTLVPLEDANNEVHLERYYSWCYSPVCDGGKPCAVLATSTETTTKVIESRRNKTLSKLSSTLLLTNSLDEILLKCSNCLRENETDAPFHVFYGFDENNKLVAKFGWSMEEKFLNSQTLEFFDLNKEFNTLFQTCVNEKKTQTFIFPGRWEKYSNYITTKECQIYPLIYKGFDSLLGVLVLGLNPFKSVKNEGKTSFHDLVASQIEAILSIVKSHQEEKKKTQILTQLDAMKTTFLQNVSHDLRTPLTLILGGLEKAQNSVQIFLKTFQENNNNLEMSSVLHLTETKLDLDLASKNAFCLLKHINHLLDYSKIENENLQPHFEYVNLSQLTIDIALGFKSICEKSKIQLFVDCSLDCTAAVDLSMWEKVLLNLLSNALKYTLEGAISVKLESSKEKERVTLTVSDTGIGIPNNEIEKIFDRFYRIKETRGRTFEGSGIGLTLVREFVKLHLGSIQVKSEVNKGTSFIVEIPKKQEGVIHDNNNIILQQKSFDRNNLRPYLSEFDVQISPIQTDFYNKPEKDTILVVEDNQDMQNFIVSIIQQSYNVLIASNGKKAIEILCENENKKLPDLILSDVLMPEMDGMKLLENLKKSEKLSSIPIILLSARAGEESKVEGILSGADDYLVKPFSSKELMARISSHLDLAKKRNAQTQFERDQREKAEKLSRSKDHFLAVLSHELRTPLTPVLLLAEDILQNNKDLPSEFYDSISLIHRNIKLEICLIDDLLDLTKISQGKLVLNKSLTSVHQLISHTLKITDYDRKLKNLDLVLELKAEKDLIEADSSRIQQVFWNVVKNAIKFTQKGKIQIKTFLNQEKNEIQIEIQDEGIGISKEDLPKLFKSFQQANEKITQQFGGLGLGLSISKFICEAHQGSLNAKSEGINKGSTFIVKLPLSSKTTLSQANNLKSNDFLSSSNNNNNNNNNQILPNDNKNNISLNILLIEDNKSTQAIIKKLLEKKGHHVSLAGSLNETFELFKTNSSLLLSLDLLLCDIGLPDGTGWDLIKQFKILQKQEQEKKKRRKKNQV